MMIESTIRGVQALFFGSEMDRIRVEVNRGRWGHLCGLLVAVCSVGCSPAADPASEARALLSKGDLSSAAQLLRDALEQDRGDSEIQFLYGQTLSALGRPGLAEWSLRRAMQDKRWRLPAALQIAYGATSAYNFDEAIKASTLALEVDPDNIEALVLRSNAYADSRRFSEEAVTDSDKILELEPDSPKAYRPRILAFLNLNQIEEARGALELLGELIESGRVDDKTASWHCATMSIFAADGGDLAEAEEGWEKCLERFPGDGAVVVPAVAFFDGQSRVNRSIEILRRAFEIEPESQNRYWVALAHRLRLVGEMSEARALMEEAPSKANDAREEAQAWVELAEFFSAAEDSAAAIEAAERAMAVGAATPRLDPDLFFATAEMHVRVGQFERAVEIAEELRVPAHREMIHAAVAQAKGRNAEALERYAEAGRLWPDNPFARYHAGRAAVAIGDYDRALEEFRHSVRISQTETDASLQLAQILYAQGSFSAALESLRQRRGGPLDEADLLTVRILARSKNGPQLSTALRRIAADRPHLYGSAIAHAARAIEQSGDPDSALKLLKTVNPSLWRHPSSIPALRMRIRLAESSEDRSSNDELVAALRAEHPESAAAAELEAYKRLRTRVSAEAVDEALSVVLEIDPDYPLGLLTQAAAKAASDPKGSLSLLSQIASNAEVDPEDFAAICRSIVEADSNWANEARRVIEKRLAHRPLEGDLLLIRAEVGRVTDEMPDQIRMWAQRAARFGQAPRAKRIQQALIEDEDLNQSAPEGV